MVAERWEQADSSCGCSVRLGLEAHLSIQGLFWPGPGLMGLYPGPRSLSRAGSRCAPKQAHIVPGPRKEGEGEHDPLQALQGRGRYAPAGLLHGYPNPIDPDVCF